MSSDPDATAKRHREIRSYVVRGGRLTVAQTRALDENWPRFGVEAGEGLLDVVQLFGRAAPLQLEIGFGNGENLAALAAQANLSNLRVVQHDAMELLRDQIAPATLDAILVLFPDPWHKKRHHKRRLVNRAFAELALSRLKPGGSLQLATDWTPYAEWMLEVLDAVPGLRNCAADGRYMPRNPSRIATRFEKRGERLGHAVHDLCYERISLTTDACAAQPQRRLRS